MPEVTGVKDSEDNRFLIHLLEKLVPYSGRMKSLEKKEAEKDALRVFMSQKKW
jgi:hypothetical protein